MDIDANSKVVLGQTLPAEKTVRQHDTVRSRTNGVPVRTLNGNSWKEVVAPVTALSYIYKVDNNLEVAGSFTQTWSTGQYWTETLDRHGEETPEACRVVETLGHSTIGLAANYLLNNEFRFQGFANFSRHAGVELGRRYTNETNLESGRRGTDYTVLGLNAFYTPNFMDIGTFGVHVENTRSVASNNEVNSTVTALSYKFMF
jgi:hypothetical protein